MAVSPLALYRYIIVGELHGQLTQTSFHIRSGTATAYTLYTAEASSIYSDWTTNIFPAYCGCLNQEWRAKYAVLYQLYPKPGVYIEGAMTGGGTQVGNALPSFCSVVLSIRTGLTGRSNHGRLYLPGISEDLSSNSRLEGNYLGVFQSFGSLLITRYGSAGTSNNGRFGVFSRKLGVTRSSLPVPNLSYSTAGWIQATSVIARPEIATQRKRKLFRGQ